LLDLFHAQTLRIIANASDPALRFCFFSFALCSFQGAMKAHCARAPNPQNDTGGKEI
jgi:hypothetical protein